MADVVRLAASQQKPARACQTCAFVHKNWNWYFAKCGATGGYAGIERQYGNVCGPEGKLWTPGPPRQIGVIERAWRFLFGGR